MRLFSNITDRFWGYLSPRKTQQRRDKPFKVPPAPLQRVGRPSGPSMSPATRVKAWNLRLPSPPELRHHEIPPSPSSLERPYTDFEGETLIDELVETIENENAFDANEETIVVDEGHYDTKSYDPEPAQQQTDAQADTLRDAGWEEDAIMLFQKLGMRGFEPLFPNSWAFDFVMMPPMMFTDDLKKQYIKAKYNPEYHAQKALQHLLQLGARVRDAVFADVPVRTPESHIHRAINQYNKWALKDGDVHHARNIPLFGVVCGPKDADTSLLQDRILRKLKRLADRWGEALEIRHSIEGSDETDGLNAPGGAEKEYHEEPPVLYGVIASHTIMGFVSYDPLAENPTLRTVAIFDFGREDYDVWNSLAIAIFVLHCRKKMMELSPFLPEYMSPESSDPDA
ncbi:hypothetical protein GQ43DRAFT_370711 [Delitschia confertaspora ATCC 74209]|uniref:Uncharacterized protein n=1 Tax=Delitschia confertaspora ATCC 74209 TaxID=1513339 RepID=A0A9P4JLS0_9PLEO|nr:hypothetical protein GQ43DRAFT_370711 [Delitschia confertaspora ATCC 74209]